jgi:hypothetical protein
MPLPELSIQALLRLKFPTLEFLNQSVTLVRK